MNSQIAKVDLDPGGGQAPAEGSGRRGIVRFAWLPIPLLLAAIIVFRIAGLSESHEAPMLRLVLSFTFYTLVALGALILIGRSFLATGAPGLLLLECGVILWSLAGTVGDAVSCGDVNINVTIFNTAILLAGICLLAGAILSIPPKRALPNRPFWLGAGCALALGVMGLLTWAALTHRLPVFFIQGQGGTPVRFWVLISAIFVFVLSAGLLLASQRRAHSPFTFWFALALLLLAVGLFGIMIQLSLGCIVNWLSRTAQWLGGFYLFMAAVAALRGSGLEFLPSKEQSHSTLYHYALTVVIVVASAAIRLAFLPAMGTQAPFLTFFPAVTLAALYGGFRSGMLATILSAILTVYFWMEPAGRFDIIEPSNWLATVIFLLSGTMIAFVTEAMHSAQDRASGAEKQALLSAERAAASEMMRESEEKYHTLFTGMTEGFAIHELITDKFGKPLDYRFLEVNPAFERMTGLDRRDVVGKTLNEVLPGDDPKWLQLYAQVTLTGKPIQFENYSPVLKRHYEVFSYRAAPMQFAVIFMDITDRKQAEEALKQQSERLVAANKEMESFAYSVSHDLRAPLRAIEGFSRILLSKMTGKLDDDERRRFEVIRESTKKMGELIDRLLDFSRLGRQSMSIADIQMPGLVKDVSEELLAANSDRKISVKVGHLAAVWGDKVLIKQVLVNLLSNAVKFTRNREEAVIEVGSETKDSEVIFFVRDNGVGFDMQYYGKLFGVFQRLHSDEEFEGSGAGLAIVQRIIYRHGGRVWAEGEVGKGATFYFTLRCASQN